MKFDKLYQLLLAESSKHVYTNEDMDRFIRFELSSSEEVAKLVNDFVHKKGYYDLGAFVVRAEFIRDKEVVYTQYDVLAPEYWASYTIPKDPRLRYIMGKFKNGLWKYARATNPSLWALNIAHGNTPDGVEDHDFIGPPGNYHYEMEQRDATVRITEYDPMARYNVDDDVKGAWKKAITKL